MKNFFLILGWAILLAVLMINRLAQPMSDSIIIILCIISSISLIKGILMRETNRNKKR